MNSSITRPLGYARGTARGVSFSEAAELPSLAVKLPRAAESTPSGILAAMSCSIGEATAVSYRFGSPWGRRPPGWVGDTNMASRRNCNGLRDLPYVRIRQEAGIMRLAVSPA